MKWLAKGPCKNWSPKITTTLAYAATLAFVYLLTSLVIFAFAPKEFRVSTRLINSLMIGMLVNCLIWMTGPLHYEWFIKRYVFEPATWNDMILYDRDQNRVVTIVKRNSNFWRWAPENGMAAIPFTELATSTEMYVKPISANPKVRELYYTVRFFTGQFAQTIANVWRAVGMPIVNHPSELQEALQKEFGRWLKFQLYEFNEAHSQELAELYNPLDQSQQYRFRKLLEAFLLPRMPAQWEDCLTLSYAGFNL